MIGSIAVSGADRAFADLEAVDFREHQIEHDQVGLLCFALFRPSVPVVAVTRPEAFFLEVQLDQLENIVLVFDDQNFLGGGTGHGQVGPAYGAIASSQVSSAQALEATGEYPLTGGRVGSRFC